MQVSIKFQVATKGVRNDDDEHGNAIFHFYPLLNSVSTKHWQVVEEMVDLDWDSRLPRSHSHPR